MGRWKELREVYRSFLMLGQLGLSIVTPTILCLLFSWWLASHLDFGMWIYIPGFVLGMGGSASVAYEFYRSLEKQDKRKEEREGKKKKISYNRHL